MVCKNCDSKSVYKLISGESLCQCCFLRYVDKKVRKTIRMFKLVDKKDRIAIGVSGGKNSLLMLYLLHDIFKKHKNVELFVISLDEGFNDVKEAEKFCKKNKLNFYKFSYKEELGFTLDEIVKKLKISSDVVRDYVLNMKALELKAKKLALGYNLDVVAQDIVMNQFGSNLKNSLSLGPLVVGGKNFVKRIKPLYLMLDDEVATYVSLKGLKFNEKVSKDSSNVKVMLDDFELKHPGTKNGIIQSFLEILPLINKHFKKLKFCKDCGLPCFEKECEVCSLLNK